MVEERTRESVRREVCGGSKEEKRNKEKYHEQGNEKNINGGCMWDGVDDGAAGVWAGRKFKFGIDLPEGPWGIWGERRIDVADNYITCGAILHDVRRWMERRV